MEAKECRKRAQSCRVDAGRSWGALRESFLSAAQSWEQLEDRLKRLAKLKERPGKNSD